MILILNKTNILLTLSLGMTVAWLFIAIVASVNADNGQVHKFGDGKYELCAGAFQSQCRAKIGTISPVNATEEWTSCQKNCTDFDKLAEEKKTWDCMTRNFNRKV